MTAVGPLIAHDDGELGERMGRLADAHRTLLGDGRASAAERDVSGRLRDQAALARDRAADLLDVKARERLHAASDRQAAIEQQLVEIEVQPC